MNSWMKGILVGLGLVWLMEVGQASAVCTGHTKCGIFDYDSHTCVLGNEYTTDVCQKVGDACYASPCLGNCDMGDTCRWVGGGGGGGGGGGTTTVCGDSAYPTCNGSCSGGNVCKAIAATGKCQCLEPGSTTCADVVPNPNLLSTVRISPTSARFRWRAIDTVKYPRVERIILIADEDPLQLGQCVFKALGLLGNTRCNVYQDNLPVTATSYTATGLLTAGTEYHVRLLFIAPNPSRILNDCSPSDNQDYLSSCELAPDPATVAVGATRVLTTNLAANTWNVSYSRAPAAYATVTTPDSNLPYRTTVTGVANGVATVTNEVYADATPTVLACSDTAEVTVGCVSSAPTTVLTI